VSVATESDGTTTTKTWGPFTGRQLTTIICVLIVTVLFPVAAWAVTGSHVFITDPRNGHYGAVDAAGNQSGLSTAASAATPGPDAIAPSVTLTAPVVPVGSNSVTVAGCQCPRDRMQRSGPGKSARRDRLGVGKQLVGNQRIGLRRPRPGSLSLPVSRSGASERLGRTSPAALSPPLT